MSSAENERLDGVRQDLSDLLVDHIQRVCEALDGSSDGDPPPDEAIALLGAVKAAQELTHNLVSAELELRRLERVSADVDTPAAGTPEVQARIAKLRTLKSQLVEGLSGVVGTLNNAS